MPWRKLIKLERRGELSGEHQGSSSPATAVAKSNRRNQAPTKGGVRHVTSSWAIREGYSMWPPTRSILDSCRFSFSSGGQKVNCGSTSYLDSILG
ncbi:hypothetical protein Lal_00012543 [Lupinus albus]|nr:hypothetical protein Lal_00012543 [Lupinus albus]